MSPSRRDTANLLLQALSDADYALLAHNLRRTQLSFRQRLLGPHEPIEELHFFDDGVASILADDESGDPVEIGLFGREGMSGSAALLGSDRSPLACLIQIGNPSANTIGTEQLLDACRQSESLHNILL